MGEVKNLVVVSTPQGLTECNKCGACCKNLILHGNFSKETEEWIYARGCGMMGDAIVIPIRCPHLTKDNLCDIYETRPKMCRDYKCWK